MVYSNQGQYFTTISYSNLKTTLNYINIPVMLRYNLSKSLHVQAGPQFSILASSKGDLNPIQGGFFAGPPVFNQNLSSYLKGTDIAIVFGAGISLPKNLTLSVRYNIGLTNINKNSTGTTFTGGLEPSFSTAYTRNQVFQLSVSYRLGKVGK